LIKHYITKYEEEGNRFAEAWIQLNFLGKSWCFFKRKIKL